MRIWAWCWTMVILSVLPSSAALAGEADRFDHQEPGTQRALNDGRLAIGYDGGTYVGHVTTQPATGEAVWHGPCAFRFRTGAMFEGVCADGDFVRGFVRSVDGRSVRYLDRNRNDAEAIRGEEQKRGL